MNPEGFPNPYSDNHPEVSGAALEIQHAEQVTLRHLLHEITEKTANGRLRVEGEVGVDLHYPDEQTVAASLYRMEKGTCLDNPDYVGQIHVSEKVTEDGGEVVTNYFILETPDGLQMEKYTHTLGARKDEGMRSVGQRAVEVMQELVSIKESNALERELGLTFVSEQEARDLLGFLDQLVPFERES